MPGGVPGSDAGSNVKATRDNSKGTTRKAGSGDGGAKSPAVAATDDAKNRTIGHYVVGKYLDIKLEKP